SGSCPLLVLPPVAPDSPMAPPPWSPLPATPSWHALPPPCFWSSQVSASPPALACAALPSLRRGAAARRSSLLVSPKDCSPVDSPHGLHLQLRERFRKDLLVLHLHFDRGGEFSSDLLREFCRGEGILHHGGGSYLHDPCSCSPFSVAVHVVRTGRRVPRPRPPLIPGTHFIALRPSSVPPQVPLPPPPVSSLPAVPDSESDLARAATPTVPRLIATVLTNPSFESTTVSAQVAELVDFAAACRLDYATSLVAESKSASPPSVGGECALCTDVLEDRQEDFECLAAGVPHLVAMLLAPGGDPNAPDIPTPHSYAEAITGPYSSQWQTAMDAEMASWKSTGTYVDAVPPSGANIVSGMWIFRVKRPPGSPPVFKARYVARGFSQQQGVDFFHTFSPTLKMTTLRVLLHFGAQRDYELHSLDFSTAFLQGSLHKEIWLRRPPGSTGSFPAGPSALRLPVLLAIVHSSAYRSLTLSSTYLLTDLGERPRSSLVLYVDNKAMIALCQEHRQEHRMKHIALRYFLARELQQCGQLCLIYVATRANTTDIFTNSPYPKHFSLSSDGIRLSSRGMIIPHRSRAPTGTHPLPRPPLHSHTPCPLMPSAPPAPNLRMPAPLPPPLTLPAPLAVPHRPPFVPPRPCPPLVYLLLPPPLLRCTPPACYCPSPCPFNSPAPRTPHSHRTAPALPWLPGFALHPADRVRLPTAQRCRPLAASALQPPVVGPFAACRGLALQLPPVAALSCCRPAFAARCGLCHAAALSRPCPTAAPVAALPCCCPGRGPNLNRQLRPCPAPAPAEPRCPTEPRRPAEPRRTAEPRCPTACTSPAATAAMASPTACTFPAATAAMASPTVLTFDAEGRAVDLDVWVDDLQLFV
ncbi:unnamed protein product, partial [Closterium sp. NIES-54]